MGQLHYRIVTQTEPGKTKEFPSVEWFGGDKDGNINVMLSTGVPVTIRPNTYETIMIERVNNNAR